MSQDPSASSAVRRWQLGETLRQLREQAELKHDEVITELQKTQSKWSRPKLSRIENREQGVKPREVEQLLDVYQVSDPEMRQWLTNLAATRRENGWITDIRKYVPEQFHRFLDWESALTGYREFQTLLVPGLLQTADYARAVITGVNPNLTEEEIERRVLARTSRQQILRRAKPPELHVILDSGLLDRPVGTARTMREQLRSLAEAAESPNVTIQVLPKSTGASPALEGPFSVLTLPEPIPDIGYTECPGNTAYVEDRDEVRELTLRFGILTQQSLPGDASVEAIIEAAKEYE